MKDEWPQYLVLEFDCEIWSEDRDFFGTGVACLRQVSTWSDGHFAANARNDPGEE